MAGENAIHTAKTFLYYGDTAGSLTTHIPVKDIPDLGGSASQVETTDLESYPYKTYIDGLQELDSFEFLANYTKERYKIVNDLAKSDKVKFFEVRIGQNGEHGVFAFSGKVKVWKSAISVDAPQEFKFTVTPGNGVDFKETP